MLPTPLCRKGWGESVFGILVTVIMAADIYSAFPGASSWSSPTGVLRRRLSLLPEKKSLNTRAPGPQSQDQGRTPRAISRTPSGSPSATTQKRL